MKSAIGVLFMAAVVVVWTTGCGSSEDPSEKVSAETVQKEMEEAADAAADYGRQQMDAFVADIETRLESYDEKWNELQSRAEDAEGEAQEAIRQKLDSLKTMEADVRERLEDLPSEGAAAWEEWKEGVDRAVSELDRAMDEAAAEFDA